MIYSHIKFFRLVNRTLGPLAKSLNINNILFSIRRYTSADTSQNVDPAEMVRGLYLIKWLFFFFNLIKFFLTF